MAEIEILGTTTLDEPFTSAAVIRGHGLDRGEVEHALAERHGRDEDSDVLVTDECYWRLTPRIKNCEAYTGWGCDNEGEWHKHWVEIKPHPDFAITLAYYEPAAESDEFEPGECNGSNSCDAERHIHGCFTPHKASNCDAPGEHGQIPESNDLLGQS